MYTIRTTGNINISAFYSWADANKPPEAQTSDLGIKKLLEDINKQENLQARLALMDVLDKEINQVAIKNMAIKNKILNELTSAIDSRDSTFTEEEKLKLIQLRTSFQEKYTSLESWNNTQTDWVKDTADTARQNLSRSIADRADFREMAKDSDNNPLQAKALLEWLKSIKDNPGVVALLELFTATSTQDVFRSEWTKNNPLSLWDANIAALIEFCISGKLVETGAFSLDTFEWYRSNGKLGLGERATVREFKKIYEKNRQNLDPLFVELQSFYKAGQTTQDWLLAKDRQTTPDTFSRSVFINYLSTYREGVKHVVDFKDKKSANLLSDDRSFMTLYAPKELETYFSKMDDQKISERVRKLVEIGGEKLTWSSGNEIFSEMQKKPEIRSAYIRWLNYIAKSPDKVGFFQSGKVDIGINAENSNRIVDELKKPEVQKQIQTGAESAINKQKAIIGEDPKLSIDQKKSVLDKIDILSKELSNPAKLESLSLEWATLLTNNRIGGGVGITKELNNWFADTVTVGISGSMEFGGKFGALIAIACTKEIFRSENSELGVHYGLAYSGQLLPFFGMHGRMNDFLGSITATPVGMNIFAGMRLWQGRDAQENLQSDIEKSRDAIRQLSNITKVEDINLVNTKPPIVSNKMMGIRMASDLRQFLVSNWYEQATSLESRYLMIQTALTKIIENEVMILQREKNDTGWVMSQIGLNFGQLAGIAYILPWVRFEKSDFQVGFKKVNQVVTMDENGTNELLSSAWYNKPKITVNPDATQKEVTIEFPKKWDAQKELSLVFPKSLDGSYAVWDDGKITIKNHSVDMRIKPNTKWGWGLIVEFIDKGELQTTSVDWKEENKEPELSVVSAAEFEKVMQTPSARIALSRLFFANKSGLTDFLTAYKNADISNLETFLAATEPKLKSLLRSSIRNKDIQAMYAFFFPKKWDAKNSVSVRYAAMHKLRTGLMTDYSNSRDVKIENDKMLFTAQKWIEKQFNERKNSKTLQALAKANGVDLADFDTVFQGKDSDKYYAEYNTVKVGDKNVNIKNLIGAVAGWKWGEKAHGFSMMPKWQMNIAFDAKKWPLIAEEGNVNKRWDILALMQKTQEGYMKQIYVSIEKSIQSITGDNTTSIPEQDIKTLLTTGKGTFSGKEITSSALFYKCAFGECLNFPSFAIDLGSLLYRGKELKIENAGNIAWVSETEWFEVSTWEKWTWFSVAVWYEATPRDNNNPTPSTSTPMDGDSTSTPMDGSTTVVIPASQTPAPAWPISTSTTQTTNGGNQTWSRPPKP